MTRRERKAELVPVDGVEELDVVDAEVVQDPEPLLRLRAAVYETDKGGLVVALRAEGMEHDYHLVLKPAILKLLMKLAPGIPGGANPLELLRQARDELAGGD